MHETEEAIVSFRYSDRAFAMSFLEAEIASMKAMVEIFRDQPAGATREMEETCRYTAGEVASLRLIAEEVERVLRARNLGSD